MSWRSQKGIALIGLCLGVILMFMGYFIVSTHSILFMRWLGDIIAILGLGLIVVGIVVGIEYLNQRQKTKSERAL